MSEKFLEYVIKPKKKKTNEKTLAGNADTTYPGLMVMLVNLNSDYVDNDAN